MFNKLFSLGTGTEAFAFFRKTREQLIDGKNMAWKREISQYVRNCYKKPAGSTAIHAWSALSELLRDDAYYHEAYLVGKLAADRGEALDWPFTDTRIRALIALGLAQMECLMLSEAVGTFEKAWGLLEPGVRSYNELMYSCGMNLSTAYMRTQRYEECDALTAHLKHWMPGARSSGAFTESDLCLVELLETSNMFQKKQFREGTNAVLTLERRVNQPIYYKVLAQHALFEKMNNNLQEYYALTKTAIAYAQKAGDRPEVDLYRVNLLDALSRLRKYQELLIVLSDVFEDIQKEDNHCNINQLQSLMSYLLALAQIPQMTDELDQMEKETGDILARLEAEGINTNSREYLKFKSQFALLKIYRREYGEAEKALRECLIPS